MKDISLMTKEEFERGFTEAMRSAIVEYEDITDIYINNLPEGSGRMNVMVIAGIWIPEKMENSGSSYHSRRCYRVQFSIVYTYQEISSGVHIPRAILLDNHRHHPLSAAVCQ